MEELTSKLFDFELCDDLPEGKKDNYEKMKPAFEQFEQYLISKGLKENTVQKKVHMVLFFIFDFLYVYGDGESILFLSDDTIRSFLGNWYIRKFMQPNMTEIRGFLNAIADFFTFLKKNDLIDTESLKEIKDTCKDKDWFEMRLSTYFQTDTDGFRDWIDEYNYDIC